MKNTENYNKEVGKRVKCARERAGEKQRELAKRLHCVPNYVSMIERGERSLSREFAEEIASAYGVRLEYLLLMDGFMTAEEVEKLLFQYEEGFDGFLSMIADHCSYSLKQRCGITDPIVLLDRDGNEINLSSREIDHLQRDIIDFSAAWLTRLINKKRAATLLDRGVKKELAEIEK